MKKLILIIVILLHLFAVTSAETKQVHLTKNPFLKPEKMQVKNLQDNSESHPIAVLNDRNLRATLKSDDRSIANVDGIMVFEGEVIKGYTLISVGEGTATFAKNGKEVTLSVSELHKKLNK